VRMVCSMQAKAYREIDWELASCIDGDIRDYYDLSYSEHRSRYPELAEICSKCPILNDCYAWAVVHESHGFWAGTSGKQRAEIRKNKRVKFVDPSMIDHV